MASLIRSLVANLGDFFGSKKTKHAITACVPLVLGGYAGIVPWEQVAWGCAGAFGLGGLGQAVADVGKEAAKLRGKAP